MKTEIITVRVTPEEHKKIAAAALKEDRPISVFVRRAALKEASKR